MPESRPRIVSEPTGPIWCEGWDGDLYRILPWIRDPLAPLQSVRLVTRGGETNGRINHPATWHTVIGRTAYFGFVDPTLTDRNPRLVDGGWPIRPGRATGSPFVYLTAEELIRDVWSHGYVASFVDREHRVLLNWADMNRHQNLAVRLVQDFRRPSKAGYDPAAARLKMAGLILRGAGKIVAAYEESLVR